MNKEKMNTYKISEASRAKLETLKYMSNLSSCTLNKMKEVRSSFYQLAAEVLSLGDSRETSTAFTHLENALMLSIKHLCLIDEQAIKEPIQGCIDEIDEVDGDPGDEDDCDEEDCDEEQVEGSPAAA